jgi:hypothetical protein
MLLTKRIHALVYAIACIITIPCAHAYKAFTTVAIADLTGEPLCTRAAYQNLPVFGGSVNPYVLSKRMHQLRYNEIVEVLERRQAKNAQDNEVLIEVPQVFFVSKVNPKPQNHYWTLESNLTPCHILSDADRAKVPKPITFHNKNSVVDAKTIALLWPFHDPTTGITFSAGTRFVLAKPYSHQDSAYHVHIFDPAKKMFITRTIPASYCIAPAPTSLQKRIAHFVQIARGWAHPGQGVIPYVWGGCSFTAVVLDLTFAEQTTIKNDIATSFYAIDGYTQFPKSGFDCSTLVCCAAQLAGLPYFYKNTYTIAHCGTPLASGESLHEGDLIVIQGHVMLVSDVEKNLLIEARAYMHGYGKIHEIELSKVFKDIATYKELEHAYATQAPLQRIDSQGQPRDTFTTFKLIALAKTLATS